MGSARSGVHSIDWRNAAVSLQACGLSGDAELHDGNVNFGGTIPSEEPMHLERSRDLSIGHVTFGDVNGDHRDEAFVPVWEIDVPSCIRKSASDVQLSKVILDFHDGGFLVEHY